MLGFNWIKSRIKTAEKDESCDECINTGIFIQISVFPEVSTGKDSFKSARIPERGFHTQQRSQWQSCATKQNKQKKASRNVLSVLDWFETQSLKQSGCRLEVNGLQSCGGAGAPGGSQ